MADNKNAPLASEDASTFSGFEFPADVIDAGKETHTLSEPLNTLLSEHERQSRLLSLMSRILARNDLYGADRALVEGMLQHARRYADQFHHHKEEQILFHIPVGKHPFMQAMISEHERARQLLREADKGLRFGGDGVLEDALKQYVALMRAHMHRENSVLFPWFNQTLDADQTANLMEQFDKLDTKEGSTLEGELEAFLESAETALTMVSPSIVPFAVLREKTIERLMGTPEVAISHMILPAGESVEGHRTNTHVYFIITHGMVTIRHSETQEEQYVQGTVVHLPPDTWMELRNEGPGTFEMFVIRAPNP